jgi:hypothetical protein
MVLRSSFREKSMFGVALSLKKREKTPANHLTHPYHLMKLSYFVSGSSLLLLGWLAVTFVSHVPSQRYQKPGNMPTTLTVPGHSALEIPAASPGGVFPISISQ